MTIIGETGNSYDEFGGILSIASQAKGFFRLDRIEGRSFFITPEGNAYLSLGINHYHPASFTADYNRGFWERRFKARAGTEGWTERYFEKFADDMDAIGLNTVGIHNDDRLKRGRPYVQPLRFVNHAYYLNPEDIEFPDVFAPPFAAHCDAFAREQAGSRKDDPWLLGYSFTDCPVLTETEAAPRPWSLYCKKHPGVIPWSRRLRNLGAGSAGKKVYTDLMAERYDADISAFNSVYGTQFASFEALLGAENWRSGYDLENKREHADNARFLEKIVAQYYKTTTDAVRKHDPNHVVFGDKMNWNTGFDDFVVKTAGKYCDLTLYLFYGFPDEHLEYCERAHTLTGKPVYSGDSNFVTPQYPNMPYPFGPSCGSQEERGRITYLALHMLFARPYFVGWDWCGAMDQWISYERSGQHSGLQNPFGEFHQPVLNALRDTSIHLYDIARLRAGRMQREDDWHE